MSDAGLIIIFILVVIGISVLAHKLIRFNLIASIVAGFFIIIICMLIDYISAGFLGPFYKYVFIIGWLVAFILSLLIGFVVKQKGKLN